MTERLPWEPPDAEAAQTWPVSMHPDWVPPWARPDPPTPVGPAVAAPYPLGQSGGYAATALAGEIERVRSATNGTRNANLNRAAFCLGQLVAGGELDEITVVRELTAAAELVGLDPREIGPTIRSGLNSGAQQPRGVPARSNGTTSATAPAGQIEHDPDEWGLALRAEIAQQRLRREAKRRLDAEERPPAHPPEVLTLRERLARPRLETTYRIEGWQPTGSRVMLAAQFKAGKTTLVGNLVRSLVDGDRFLGQHTVTPVVGTVAVLDFEMSPHQLDGWLADQRIQNDDQVIVLPMRGSAAAFDILDHANRARWATLLRQRQVSYLVLDCLRPVLDSLGLDEHREAGRFLVALDSLLAEADIGEACVVHHMGHAAERSRGDSRLRDWPDVEWRLVRQDDDPASGRFLSAYGRDVDQPETGLAFDTATRHLSISGGSRKDSAAREALADVLALLDREPQLSFRAIERGMAESDHSRDAVRAAIKIGIREGAIVTEGGPRNSILHTHRASVPTVRPLRDAQSSECASASIETHTQTLTLDPPTVRAEPPSAHWRA